MAMCEPGTDTLELRDPETDITLASYAIRGAATPTHADGNCYAGSDRPYPSRLVRVARNRLGPVEVDTRPRRHRLHRGGHQGRHVGRVHLAG